MQDDLVIKSVVPVDAETAAAIAEDIEAFKAIFAQELDKNLRTAGLLEPWHYVNPRQPDPQRERRFDDRADRF